MMLLSRPWSTWRQPSQVIFSTSPSERLFKDEGGLPGLTRITIRLRHFKQSSKPGQNGSKKCLKSGKPSPTLILTPRKPICGRSNAKYRKNRPRSIIHNQAYQQTFPKHQERQHTKLKKHHPLFCPGKKGGDAF